MGLPIIFKKKGVTSHSKVENDEIQKLMIGYSTVYDTIGNNDYTVAMAKLSETSETLWSLSTKNWA